MMVRILVGYQCMAIVIRRKSYCRLSDVVIMDLSQVADSTIEEQIIWACVVVITGLRYTYGLVMTREG